LSILVGLAWPRLAPYSILLLPLASRVFARLTGQRSTSPTTPAAARVWFYVGYFPVLLFVVWSAVLLFTGDI
jgi:hypothetical protein